MSRSFPVTVLVACLLLAIGAALESPSIAAVRAALVGQTGVAAAGMPSEIPVIALSEQTDRGGMVFANVCAKCHGQQGQGDQAPRLIGTPNGLAEYKTVQGLFDYVSSQMPNDTPGSLKSEEYWDVLAYILDANKILPADTVLGPDNAANVNLMP